ncbi:MAG: FecR domain-containing protein [Candidatus Omnitrophica bacterium]|nr:FecR domain-containing protein [Candidatus Omnitrophota bacterium]
MLFGHPSIYAISRSVDGMLKPDRQSALKNHLDGCASCQVKEKALIKVKNILGSLPVIEGGLAVKEPLLPLPVIVGRLVFHRGLSIGLLFGIVLIGATVLWVPQPALKVISANYSSVSGSEKIIETQQVQTGDALRTLPPGYVDLEIPGRVLLRLKPGTTLTWQQLDRPFLIRRPLIIVNLMRGELLGRTKESFWGSNLVVRTPTASAFVKGTAFGLSVDPKQDATTLKVIAGSVFFSPYMNRVGIEVRPGEMSRIQEEKLPEPPAEMDSKGWESVLEAYQIGEQPTSPPVALVIGIGSSRVEDLLRPALLYVSNWDNPDLQPFLRKAVREINRAILTKDPEPKLESLKILEMALNGIRNEDIAVPLQLFTGAYALHVNNPWRAQFHFRMVAEKYPRHQLASLGLAAIAVAAVRRGDRLSAQDAFEELLAKYPKSREAEYIHKLSKTTKLLQ